mmetsp:Transcript_5411/g.5541  ORF Transcript_5411/g.5541 Transcript_5411/m.5541 type:complete len:509 (+) Transcript_5411:31-1557(+)
MMSYNQNKTLEDLKLLQETINHIKLQISILKDIQIRNLQEDNNNNNTGIEEGNNNDYYYSSGDTAWMIFATILVIFMTLPGIMIYYAGMVRLQNALSTAMQGFGLVCVITFLWLCFGYSLSFGPSHSKDVNAVIFGDSSRFWLHGIYHSNTYHDLAPTIPESVFCCFQLAFAIITPTLICGAFADRMKYLSVLISLGLWHLVVYCPIAHSNWHPDGFLHKAGVLDFAGGNVVHISAGVSALVSAIIVGKRTGYETTQYLPHNLLLSLVGSCFLMAGWIGFNSGSYYAADIIAGFSILNTFIAGSFSSMTWLLIDIFTTGKPKIYGVMNGYLAGCVGITPAAGYVDPCASFVIGVICGCLCRYGCKLKVLFSFDDSLDAFGIHCVSGIIGGIMVGLFANDSIHGHYGLIYGKPTQILIQLYGITITILWSSIGTALIFLLVDKVIGLRVTKRSEVSGLDQSEHGTTLAAQILHIAPLKRAPIEKKKLEWFISVIGIKLSKTIEKNTSEL